jgi:UDP-2,3-diacylglucosamine hydrolase
MATYFISDLHLQESHPDIMAHFVRFCETDALTADTVYILGDLFEYFIGDDDKRELLKTVESTLQCLSQKVPVYFIAGNRDFLLGKKFAKRAGLTLLTEPARIDLYGTPFIVLHGDLLCSDDKEYQAFRQKVRRPWFQKLYLMLPLFLRQKIADKARQKSAEHIQNTEIKIQDVNQDTVKNMLQQHQVFHMIHGHTHQAAIHSFMLEKGRAKRFVLGDWTDKKAMILKYEPNHQYELFSWI